ncbi:MAG: type IV toxin-antitoxin system AbiEi family antitoxin domain-containing protein [Proteobacteria bacterium]|nr:type IV toxin-antitoxin system AbiEi family antitoxin domain-containing protein [Pseudomonadota bacterium]
MKYNELSAAIKSPFFSRNDLALSGYNVLDYQLSLWVKKGYLVRLKNGIYAFSREKEKLRGEGIAFLLCQPSYLSLESALAWYGFIPEIVYAYTSVTARITRTFENACGRFIYRHVKSELFWGYVEMKTDHGPYLLAEPEKALLDYLYLNLARINNEDDFENIRLNEEQMGKTLNKDKFMIYLKAFGGKKMDKWARRCLL